MTKLAFIGMCIAWGFSWFAMKLQVQSFVAPEISLFYRFASVAALMTIISFASRTRLKFFKSELPFFASIALTNFCLNFLIGYHASKLIASGMIAVIFSLSIIVSEVLKSLLEGKKIEKNVVVSGIFGFFGLCFFVIPTLKLGKNNDLKQTALGLALAFAMMLVFSLGNFLVEKNRRKNHTPLFTLITYCSFFSSIYFIFLNFVLGNKLEFDPSFSYVASLFYQIIFASILAFSCLFFLIQKIGAARANYTSLVYPTIALLVSSFFEDFRFTFLGTFGLALIILALAIEFIPAKKIKLLVNSLQKNKSKLKNKSPSS